MSACCYEGYPAAPATPVAESVRIRILQECVAQQALPPPINDTCINCNQDLPQRRLVITIGERDRALTEVSRCPVYYRNPHTGALCPGQAATHNDTDRHQSNNPPAPLLETTRPYRIHQYRTHPRIRGIDEITRLVRSTTAGELTARRRAAIESSSARHAEHFRAEIPPPPCRPPQRGQQAGVPLAPQTPCIPGLQRVDARIPGR